VLCFDLKYILQTKTRIAIKFGDLSAFVISNCCLRKLQYSTRQLCHNCISNINGIRRMFELRLPVNIHFLWITFLAGFQKNRIVKDVCIKPVTNLL
jgi:hypothetical protein